MDGTRLCAPSGFWWRPGAGRLPPEVAGGELAISSNEIFDLAGFPERLVIVGGGYIACEFASIFNGLGSRVVQLCRAEQILRGFDDEVRDFVAAEMRKKGVDVRPGSKVTGLSKTGAAGPIRVDLGTRRAARLPMRCSTPPGASRTRPVSASRRSASISRRTAPSSSTRTTAAACRASMRWAT